MSGMATTLQRCTMLVDMAPSDVATEVICVRADVNTVNFHKRTPLHIVATYGFADVALKPPKANQLRIAGFWKDFNDFVENLMEFV